MSLTGLAHAATYYVSPSGNDSNSGSQAAPFQHLSRGAAVARAGDTVVAMDGTYGNEGQVANTSGGGSVVVPQYSGTAGAPITFMAQNRGRAILDGSSSVQSSTLSGCYGAWAYFDLYGVSYITIQGFVIQNTCIQAIASNGNGQHDFTFRWNEFKNIGNWTPPSGYNPQGNYANASEYNFTFDGNIFHDIGGGPVVNLQHGIYTSASNVTVVNNIFYNITHGWAIPVAAAKNMIIANNTFAFPNPNRAGQIILWDESSANSLQNIVIQNNVFYQPLAYPVVAELDAGGSIVGCTMQSNLTTTGAVFDHGTQFGGGGVNCSESNSMTGSDPRFMNPSGYDFHLQTGSPAIDSGTNNSYTTVDMESTGRPINNIYDRGSYEAHMAVTSSSITLSASPASLSVTQGGSAVAAITANVSGTASPVFSVSGLPSGVTASFAPSSCTGSCTSTLTLYTSGTYQGTSTLAVTASGASSVSPVSISLSVTSNTPTGDYTSGLAGEWKLQTNANEALSGADNGQVTGGTVWGTGTYNGINNVKDLVLNGSTGFVTIPEKTSQDMTQQLTVSFWVISLPTVSGAVTDPRVVAKVYDWDVKLNGNLYPQLSANGQYAVANYAIPYKTWTHVAFTFSGGLVKAYINGQPVSLGASTFNGKTKTLPNNHYGMYIGTDSSRTQFFNGGVNDVRIYNRVLGAADVAALYFAVNPATLQ